MLNRSGVIGTTPTETEENLLSIIKKLEADKLWLDQEMTLHKMVLINSAEIIKIIIEFFLNSFKEIDMLGFNLNGLDTVKSVLSDSHLYALRSQIRTLQKLEAQTQQDLPSVKILKDFLDLLTYIKGL